MPLLRSPFGGVFLFCLPSTYTYSGGWRFGHRAQWKLVIAPRAVIGPRDCYYFIAYRLSRVHHAQARARTAGLCVIAMTNSLPHTSLFKIRKTPVCSLLDPVAPQGPRCRAEDLKSDSPVGRLGPFSRVQPGASNRNRSRMVEKSAVYHCMQ